MYIFSDFLSCRLSMLFGTAAAWKSGLNSVSFFWKLLMGWTTMSFICCSAQLLIEESTCYRVGLSLIYSSVTFISLCKCFLLVLSYFMIHKGWPFLFTVGSQFFMKFSLFSLFDWPCLLIHNLCCESKFHTFDHSGWGASTSWCSTIYLSYHPPSAWRLHLHQANNFLQVLSVFNWQRTGYDCRWLFFSSCCI